MAIVRLTDTSGHPVYVNSAEACWIGTDGANGSIIHFEATTLQVKEAPGDVNAAIVSAGG
jgi:hypothetical protein